MTSVIVEGRAEVNNRTDGSANIDTPDDGRAAVVMPTDGTSVISRYDAQGTVNTPTDGAVIIYWTAPAFSSSPIVGIGSVGYMII